MTSNCLRSGWRASFGRPRLVAVLWSWNVLLGLGVGWGMSRWLGAAFNWSPEADRSLVRFQFGLLAELTQYDRFSAWNFAGGAFFGLLGIAVVSNALIAAGILEVLVSDDPRPLLHRFLRGAGHFFGRFLRLLIVTGLALLLALIIVGALTRPIVSAIGESSWERTWIAAGLLRWALLGLLAALSMAVLDLARAQVASAATEQRGMLRAWLRAVRVLTGNFQTIAATYLVLGLCWLVLAVIGLAIVSAVPVETWVGIWLLIIVQQLFMFARAGIRVTRAGATLEMVRAASAGTAALATGGYTEARPTTDLQDSEDPKTPEDLQV